MLLMACGVESERKQIFVDDVNEIDQASDATYAEDEEPAPQPQMITGSYLTSCHWEGSKADISCIVSPKQPQDELVSFIDFAVDLKAKNGRLISEDLYQTESTMQNGSLIIKVTLSAKAKSRNIYIQISADKDDDAGPYILGSLSRKDISPKKPQIEIFSQVGFSGISETFSFGSFTQLDDFSSFEQSIASLKIPKGLAVTLCDEAGSRCMDLYGDVKDLKSMNGKASTLNVYQSEAFATIFEHFSWAGRSQKIPLGSISEEDFDLGLKNRVSAFHIPQHFILTACTDINGVEPCYIFSEDTYRLPGGQNDKFKFLNFSPVDADSNRSS